MNRYVLKRGWTIVLAMVFGLPIAVGATAAQEQNVPLTRDELVNLCRQGFNDPDKVLNDFVRRDKIAFLPTKKVVSFLNNNGCPARITDELKHNFASRLVYRVCKFDPPEEGGEFARLLSRKLGEVKGLLRRQGDLLSDKTFDPALAHSDGMTQEELNSRPHDGFLLIMGVIETGSNNQRSVTARLVFMSKVQGRTEIISPKQLSLTNASRETIAKQIARWSIEEVENQIR